MGPRQRKQGAIGPVCLGIEVILTPLAHVQEDKTALDQIDQNGDRPLPDDLARPFRPVSFNLRLRPKPLSGRLAHVVVVLYPLLGMENSFKGRLDRGVKIPRTQGSQYPRATQIMVTQENRGEDKGKTQSPGGQTRGKAFEVPTVKPSDPDHKHRQAGQQIGPGARAEREGQSCGKINYGASIPTKQEPQGQRLKENREGFRVLLAVLNDQHPIGPDQRGRQQADLPVPESLGRLAHQYRRRRPHDYLDRTDHRPVGAKRDFQQGQKIWIHRRVDADPVPKPFSSRDLVRPFFIHRRVQQHGIEQRVGKRFVAVIKAH